MVPTRTGRGHLRDEPTACIRCSRPGASSGVCRLSTTTGYRPVGAHELKLIEDSGPSFTAGLYIRAMVKKIVAVICVPLFLMILFFAAEAPIETIEKMSPGSTADHLGYVAGMLLGMAVMAVGLFF